MASQWFVRGKGKVYGPLDSKSLRQLVADGKINEFTEIAQNEAGPWLAAGNVRGLFTTAAAPPPAPLPAPATPPPAAATAVAVANSTESPVASMPKHKSATRRRGSYVDANLLPGEEVMYRGKLHPLYFAPPVLWVILAFYLFSEGQAMNARRADAGMGVIIAGGFALMASFGSLLLRIIGYMTSEFAVTNKRVIMKQGFIRRQTLELLLGKVDSLAVDQGIAGRIFGYGNVRVAVATEKQTFKFLANPLEFRRQVQGRAPA